MKTIILVTMAAALAGLSAAAAPLTESTYTEVVNDVSTVSTAGTAATAKVNDLIRAPDRVRTGAQSRTELTAPDHTITRVGANTIFSFSDNGRTLNLEQGNLLFHAPKGLGGGTIKTAGAAAAVLGTTLIVSATPNGGFKVILLEGTGQVKLPNGTGATVHAGQLVYVLPGGKLSPVLTINLGKLVGGSQLVKGFANELPSMALIREAIDAQNKLFAAGKAVDTGWPVDSLAPPVPGNNSQSLDHAVYNEGAPQTIPVSGQIAGPKAFAGPVPPGGRSFAPLTAPGG